MILQTREFPNIFVTTNINDIVVMAAAIDADIVEGSYLKTKARVNHSKQVMSLPKSAWPRIKNTCGVRFKM